MRAPRLAPLVARLKQEGNRLEERWRALSPSRRRVTLAACALALVLAVVVSTGSTGCSTHADVEARVADLTSQLQQAAARGHLPLDALAERVKRINAAATMFDSSKDAAGHCEALERLR